MKILLLMICLLCSWQTQAKKPRDCTGYEEALEHIQSKLRAGYKEPKGNRLRKARREAEEKLAKCKKGN